MGDFREKYPATDFERKKARKEIPGKNNILHWKKYYSWRIMLKKEKKSFTVYMWGKKFSTPEVWEKIITSTKSPIHPSPTNVQWSCQPFRGWGKKRIWHLSKCHPSTKWLARVHHFVVFKTKVLHVKIAKTPMKDRWKEKFSGMLSFLFVDKRKLFAIKLSFQEFTLVSTRRIVALGLFWTNQGSEDSEETWGTFCTLWSKDSTFLKGNFCIYKGFLDDFYILYIGVKEKPQNVHFKLIFCPLLNRFNLRERIHDLVFVTRIAF